MSLIHRTHVLVRRSAAQLSRLAPARHACPCCRSHFAFFLPFRFGTLSTSPVMRKLRAIGSDPKRFQCPACGANDRERHLWLYFDALNLWESFRGARVLHIAPERKLRDRIQEMGPAEYVPGDLHPTSPGVQRVDVTDIGFASGRFDVVLCNHVLEHVPDDLRAMREILRVLRPGGIAVLQTPYSELLDDALEDGGITDEGLRWFMFGLRDHVRVYGRGLFERLAQVGFELDVRGHSATLSQESAHRFGVNEREDLIMVRRPRE